MLRKYAARTVTIASAIALTVGLATGCAITPSKKKSTIAAPLQSVSVETVKLTNQSIGHTYLGTITPYVQTQLSPGASGQLATLNVRAGDHVTKGETLATLDKSTLVPQRNQADQAQAALVSAQQAYQNAQAMYQDNLSSDQQVASAKDQVAQQKAALDVAKANLNKAQLSEQQTLAGTATTQQQKDALSAVVSSDQEALTSAQKQLQIAQDNLAILKKTYDTAQSEYGSITQAQVQQANQDYQAAMSHFKSFEQGSFAGSNPYQSSVTSTQSIYNNLNNGYTALQSAKQQYNQGLQAVSSAQSGVASAKAQLATAQKNQSDAAPPSNTTYTAQVAQATLKAAQATYQQAKTQYQSAVTSYQFTQKIATDKTQAKQSLDSAANQLRQDKASAQSAKRSLQAQMKDNQVISPISGIVQSVGAQVGQSVGPSTNLVTVAAESPQMATINVPEADIGKISKKAAVNIAVPTLNQTFSGHVFAIHPQLDTSTNEYPVDVVIAGSHSQLLPGIQVQATLADSAKQKELLVPADAVLSLQSGAQEVFVYANGTVHTRLVQVGQMSSTQYQITSGLKSGEQLVVQGQNLLSDGDKVKVVSQDGNSTGGGNGTKGSAG